MQSVIGIRTMIEHSSQSPWELGKEADVEL